MRIVVGLDGSASSLAAHALVAGTPWPLGTEFVFLRVHDLGMHWGATMPGGGWYENSDYRDEQREELKELDELADVVRGQGHPVQIRHEEGPPGQLLREAAAEFGADLIVVGSRGRGPAASAFLGSVSADLVHHAPCPILVARTPGVTRVLVAADGSDSARTIPDILASWRAFERLPIEVVSVAPTRATGTELMVTPWAVPHLDQRREAAAEVSPQHRRAVEETVEALGRHGWSATGHVRRGDAADEIVESARDLGCDLIVTGSRGLGDLHRLLTGSVAHDVLLHSRCSVLVMRGHVPARAARPVPVGARASIA